MTELVRFFVPGIPRPGGSKRAFAFTDRRTGKLRATVADSSGENGKAWRSAIVGVAANAWPFAPLDEPLELHLTFTMPRPRAHYSAKGLKPTAPHWHTSAPDVTKLVRAAEDSLNALLFRDDCLIVTASQSKTYGERPGVEVVIARPATP